MLGQQAYIKNMGSTQTFIKRPNEKERFNDIHWEADYDGNQANIHLNIDDNGNNTEVRANLDNNDLARLLNIPAVRGDLDERLTADFSLPLFEKVQANQEQKPILLLEQTPEIILREPLHPKLKFQPFLRPAPVKKTRKAKYNKLAKALKETREDAPPRLVGKTAALQYRTPLPKTMRIHLTSDSKGGRRLKRSRKRGQNSRRANRRTRK
jgi:hypothetical protein